MASLDGPGASTRLWAARTALLDLVPQLVLARDLDPNSLRPDALPPDVTSAVLRAVNIDPGLQHAPWSNVQVRGVLIMLACFLETMRDSLLDPLKLMEDIQASAEGAFVRDPVVDHYTWSKHRCAGCRHDFYCKGAMRGTKHGGCVCLQDRVSGPSPGSSWDEEQYHTEYFCSQDCKNLQLVRVMRALEATGQRKQHWCEECPATFPCSSDTGVCACHVEVRGDAKGMIQENPLLCGDCWDRNNWPDGWPVHGSSRERKTGKVSNDPEPRATQKDRSSGKQGDTLRGRRRGGRRGGGRGGKRGRGRGGIRGTQRGDKTPKEGECVTDKSKGKRAGSAKRQPQTEARGPAHMSNASRRRRRRENARRRDS